MTKTTSQKKEIIENGISLKKKQKDDIQEIF